MNRHKRILTTLSTIAATAMVVAGCTGASQTSGGTDADGLTTTTAVGGGASMSYTVPQLMDSMNAGEANGLNIDYQGTGTSSSNMVAAVLSGDADFGFPAAVTAIDAIEEGADLIIVASGLKYASILGLRTEVAERTGTSADAPIEDRLKALRGLTIATTPEGSGNNTLLRKAIADVGLNPDKDVKIVGVQDPSAIVGGIKEGRFDGGFYGAGVIEANIASGEAELWISGARGDLDEMLGDQIGMVMVTTKRTFNKNPDLVSAMFDSVVDVEKSISSDPAAAGDLLQEDWFPDLDPKVFDIAWDEAQNAYPKDGTVSKDQFDAILGFMSAGDKSYSLKYDDVVYSEAQR